jgi:hypothetical protein
MRRLLYIEDHQWCRGVGARNKGSGAKCLVSEARDGHNYVIL